MKCCPPFHPRLYIHTPFVIRLALDDLSAPRDRAYRTSEPAEWEIRGWCYLPPTIRLSTQKEIERVLKDTLSQPQGWFKALGIPPTKAQVEFAPTNDFLPPYSVKQIADFLIPKGTVTSSERKSPYDRKN